VTLVQVPVPDIGEFEDVEVIEILVEVGQRVAREDSLVTLESDKASVEIPSPYDGVVREILVSLGDLVSEGAPMVAMEIASDARAESGGLVVREKSEASVAAASEVVAAPRLAADADDHAEVVVLGGGPGGYTAAFRAADLGKRVTLIEREATLGGVCLNVGCIPSKALLHVASVMEEVAELQEQGVRYGAPELDLGRIRSHKDSVVGTLTGGLARLAKQRQVNVLRGTGRFANPNQIEVETPDGMRSLTFDAAIVAVGSRTVELPDFPHDDPRVMDSTDALELDEIPQRLLVVGGGIIGLEMATVYQALGSRITVVELLDHLMTGVDRDLVRPLLKRLEQRFENIFTGTKVAAMTAREDGICVSFEGSNAPAEDRFDRVLVAVGRRPNGDRIRAERAGVQVDERGFIAVDDRRRTNVPHIYAIGDVTGVPLLAHKATHEGKAAAEVIAGLSAAFDPGAIPSVAYTDPEIAWMGLTEDEARERGHEIQVAKFPWAASGRALGAGRSEGLTKLIFAAETGSLLGAGITGVHAGELIAESVLALEMGADAEDLGLTIHPHPTLSETLGMAAEIAHGTVTDLYFPPSRRKRTTTPKNAG